MRVVFVCGNSFGARGIEAQLWELGKDLEVSRASCLQDAMVQLQEIRPAVIVFSAELSPQAPGALMNVLPETGEPPGMLVVAPSGTHPEEIIDYVRPGWGFLFDSSHPDLLRPALEAVAAGTCFIDPSAVLLLLEAESRWYGPEEVLARIDPNGVLPKRCRTTVILAAYGWSDGWIADALHRSEDTVGRYLWEAYRCLGVSGRHALRALCRQESAGWAGGRQVRRRG